MMNASWWNIHPFVFTQSLFSFQGTTLWRVLPFRKVVGSSGLEPPTSRLSGARSNRLSYEPITTEMRAFRIEQRMRRGLCSDQSIGDADRSASRFSLERR